MTSKKKSKKTTPRSRKKVAKKRTKSKRVVKMANESNGHAGWTAARIVALRNKLRLTQEQFSQKLGVTYVSVNRWENGKVLPKGLSIRALVELEATA